MTAIPLYANGTNINDHWSPATKRELERDAAIHHTNHINHLNHNNGGSSRWRIYCECFKYNGVMPYLALVILAAVAATAGWLVYTAAVAEVYHDYEQIVTAACGERATTIRLSGEQVSTMMTGVLSMITSSFAVANTFTVGLFTRYIKSQDITSKGVMNLSWQARLVDSQRARFESNYFPVTTIANGISFNQTQLLEYIVDISTLPYPVVPSYIGRDVLAGIRSAAYNKSIFDYTTRALAPAQLNSSVQAIAVLIPVPVSTIGLDNDEWVQYAQCSTMHTPPHIMLY